MEEDDKVDMGKGPFLVFDCPYIGDTFAPDAGFLNVVQEGSQFQAENPGDDIGTVLCGLARKKFP